MDAFNKQYKQQQNDPAEDDLVETWKIDCAQRQTDLTAEEIVYNRENELYEASKENDNYKKELDQYAREQYDPYSIGQTALRTKYANDFIRSDQSDANAWQVLYFSQDNPDMPTKKDT